MSLTPDEAAASPVQNDPLPDELVDSAGLADLPEEELTVGEACCAALPDDETIDPPTHLSDEQLTAMQQQFEQNGEEQRNARRRVEDLASDTYSRLVSRADPFKFVGNDDKICMDVLDRTLALFATIAAQAAVKFANNVLNIACDRGVHPGELDDDGQCTSESNEELAS